MFCGGSRVVNDTGSDAPQRDTSIGFATIGNIGLDIFSPGTQSLTALKDQLKDKISEVERLRENVSQLEAEKDTALIASRQYQQLIEAQEAEIQRIKDRLPGGASAKQWQQRMQRAQQQIDEMEAKKKELEASIAVLKDQVETLAMKVDEQEKQIREIQLNVLDVNDANDDDDDTKPTVDYSARDSSTDFFARVQSMRQGELISYFLKDKLTPVYIRLNETATDLAISYSATKKPFMTIPFASIESCTYPVVASGKKAKAAKAGADYLQFSLETPEQSHVFLATGFKQLNTWFLGIQNLASKPGQRMLSIGNMLWLETRSKIRDQAQQRGVTPAKMVAEAIKQMLPAEDEVDLRPVDDGEGSNISE